jgi:hypothetical protein
MLCRVSLQPAVSCVLRFRRMSVSQKRQRKWSRTMATASRLACVLGVGPCSSHGFASDGADALHLAPPRTLPSTCAGRAPTLRKKLSKLPRILAGHLSLGLPRRCCLWGRRQSWRLPIWWRLEIMLLLSLGTLTRWGGWAHWRWCWRGWRWCAVSLMRTPMRSANGLGSRNARSPGDGWI